MPRQVDREERRRRIADAVFRLVAERGIEDVGLREVAAEAGISMGQVQHWFSTKHEMLLFTLGRTRERVLDRLARDLAALESPTVRDRILAGLRVMLPLDEPGREETTVNIAFVAASFGSPQFADVLRTGYTRLALAGRDLLAEARDRGELVDGVDADAEADTLFYLAQGLIAPVLLGVCPPQDAMALIEGRLDRILRRSPAPGTDPGIVAGMIEDDADVRETRLRRVAERQGLTLLKSPERDPDGAGFGTYMLVETDTATVKVSGSPAGYGLTLDDVEDVLAR